VGVHDQRFKALLQEFLPDFLRLFFPAQAAAIDFEGIEWLQQELVADPPAGDVYLVDLVARVHTQFAEAETALTSLVLLEIESREAATATRSWLYHYYEALRRRHNLPVLPVALYLRVGMDGIGIDSYVETYGALEVLNFNYLYVGLPSLDAEQYVGGTSLIGVALSALMRIAAERRAWLRAEALRRVYTESIDNEYRRHLLRECVEAYLPLDTGQQREFEQLLTTERYQNMIPMATTTYEKGEIQGTLKGKRESIRLLLTKKFGPLSAEPLRRLEAWPPEQLDELLLAVWDAESLDSLGLNG